MFYFGSVFIIIIKNKNKAKQCFKHTKILSMKVNSYFQILFLFSVIIEAYRYIQDSCNYREQNDTHTRA